MPVLLLMGAVAVAATAVLFLLWRLVDRRVRESHGEDRLEELSEKLEWTVREQEHLQSRVEHLEAIVAAEPLAEAVEESSGTSRIRVR